MQRYLPFWLANLVDRMWVALLSIIVILIPLARVVPPLYAFRIRSRIYRWYRAPARRSRTTRRRARRGLLAELDKLDAKVERIAVPLPTPTSSTRCAATSAWSPSVWSTRRPALASPA